jgi:predicted nucleic acid-binding protein
MKVFFDTSVLVSAVVDQLPRHGPALATFKRYTTDHHSALCSTHALAETYATLTALPLPRRILPDEALRLIETNFIPRLVIVALTTEDYTQALRRVAGLGLSSGILYDALHLASAEKSDCQRLYTYNTTNFNRLNPDRVMVTSP